MLPQNDRLPSASSNLTILSSLPVIISLPMHVVRDISVSLELSTRTTPVSDAFLRSDMFMPCDVNLGAVCAIVLSSFISILYARRRAVRIARRVKLALWKAATCRRINLYIINILHFIKWNFTAAAVIS